MDKKNLKAVIFTALSAEGLNVKPYCIANHAYDAVYLPDQHAIIPVDIADDNRRKSPTNPIVQNNLAKKDELKVFRVRSLVDCAYIDFGAECCNFGDFGNSSILAVLNAVNEFSGGSKRITEVPDEAESVAHYENAVAEYDEYFANLCKVYADAKGVSHIRMGRTQDGEHIGVWIDFKGKDYTIEHGCKTIRSFKASFGDSMDENHNKGLAAVNANADARWDEAYKALKSIFDEKGTIAHIKRTDKKFGGWLTRQRIAYREGRLSQERIDLLNALNIDWNPQDTKTGVWDERVDELLEYEKANGTMDVPQKDGPLGKWVAKQRQQHRQGTLLPEREARLNEIGFFWKSPNGR